MVLQKMQSQPEPKTLPELAVILVVKLGAYIAIGFLIRVGWSFANYCFGLKS